MHSYLFRRKDSDNWYCSATVQPGQNVIERSLGTPDDGPRRLAAADIIKQHKQLIYARRLAPIPRVEPLPWKLD